MKKVLVEFEFDDKKLGPDWLNKDNLESLLYGDHCTYRNLLKVNKLEEVKNKDS